LSARTNYTRMGFSSFLSCDIPSCGWERNWNWLTRYVPGISVRDQLNQQRVTRQSHGRDKQ